MYTVLHLKLLFLLSLVTLSVSSDETQPETYQRSFQSNALQSQSIFQSPDFSQLVRNSIYRLNPYFNLTKNGFEAVRASRTSLSPKSISNLAVIGLLVYGAMVSFAPEKMNEISRHFALEDRQGVQNLITSGLVGVSESLMGWVEKSVDDLPSLPRLDAQECMKRCICEAHNQPKKYGLIGLGLQLFFPPYTETDEPSRIVSKYQLAARYGRQDNANCAVQYDDCMVNMLDVVQGVFNVLF